MDKIAILLPCYNEEQTIGSLIKEIHQVLYQHALPGVIYVYDNNSTDNTAQEAKNAGAFVFHEQHQGKGNVIKRMFADIEADIYILMDGDHTYDVDILPDLIRSMKESMCDMIIGKRVTETSSQAYPPFHHFGNHFISRMVQWLYHYPITDVLSGYRILSKRFVKSFPIKSKGFDIEMEMTIHALDLKMIIKEEKTQYKKRPQGSLSKLKTFKDGFKIITALLKLFFSKHASILAFFSFILSCALLNTNNTISFSLFFLSFVFVVCASHYRQSLLQKRLAYLSIPLSKP